MTIILLLLHLLCFVVNTDNLTFFSFSILFLHFRDVELTSKSFEASQILHGVDMTLLSRKDNMRNNDIIGSDMSVSLSAFIALGKSKVQ